MPPQNLDLDSCQIPWPNESKSASMYFRRACKNKNGNFNLQVPDGSQSSGGHHKNADLGFGWAYGADRAYNSIKKGSWDLLSPNVSFNRGPRWVPLCPRVFFSRILCCAYRRTQIASYLRALNCTPLGSLRASCFEV